MIYERRKAIHICPPQLVFASDGMQIMIELQFKGSRKPIYAWTPVDLIGDEFIRTSASDFERYRDRSELDEAVTGYLSELNLDPNPSTRMSAAMHRRKLSAEFR